MALPSLFKTPDQYLASMIDRIGLLGSKLTDFTEGSNARNLFEALGTGLSQHSAVADQHRKDSYLSTATGDALTAKALDQGVQRKAAVKATGTVRITRTVTTAAVTIPAGWSPLATVPTPGITSVTYQTLAAAVFGIGVSQVDVLAEAVEGGTNGNIVQGPTAQVTLLPVNPVPGFDTSNDFKARGPFAGGVDEETDDQLRARVPIAVQGRVKGKRASFLAAALAVPGVVSAQVRQAGETKVGGTVAGGNVQVYFEGATTLLPQVQTACADATVASQNVTVDVAVDVPVTATLTVFVIAGTDPNQTAIDVKAAVTKAVADTGVGDLARFSRAVQAVHAVPVVQSASIPFADFRKTSAAPGTSGDIDPGVGSALSILQSAITVTVTNLP